MSATENSFSLNVGSRSETTRRLVGIASLVTVILCFLVTSKG